MVFIRVLLLPLFGLLVCAAVLHAQTTDGLPADDEGNSFEDQPLDYNPPFLTTPQEIVEKMLLLAGVTKHDILYDLGSGDGRIVITAAKKYGARAVGFEIEPQLVRESEFNARTAGVEHLVEFRLQDILTTDFSGASVVTMYLLPETNLLLRTKLQQQLRPGSRIVSHDFGMGDWEPDDYQEITDSDGNYYQLYLWRVPERADSKKS